MDNFQVPSSSQSQQTINLLKVLYQDTDALNKADANSPNNAWSLRIPQFDAPEDHQTLIKYQQYSSPPFRLRNKKQSIDYHSVFKKNLPNGYRPGIPLIHLWH